MSCYVLGGGRRKGLPNRCCDRAQRCSRRLLPRGATGARQGLPAAHRRCLAGPVQCARPAARGSADGRSGGRGGGGGLVLSGLIVDNLSYEWIFWFGLIVVLVAMVATHLFVPESPVKSPARIDWTGAALLSAGLVCMLLAVSQGNDWGWDSARIVGLFAAAAVILTAWVRFEQRQPQPLVDIALLRRRGVWTTNLTGLLIGFGMFGSFILIPQFVQTPEQAGYGFGADVTAAGLFLLPAAAVKLVAG